MLDRGREMVEHGFFGYTTGDGGLFEAAGQFPSPHYLDFPLTPEANRFFEHGAPFLQRYLPFWAATAADRLKVMLVPLFALMLPLMKILPPAYRWRVRSRIVRWYRQLQRIDRRLAEPLDDALVELARLEREVARLNVPISYADQVYHLRLHIHLVRDALGRRLPPFPTDHQASHP